MAVLEVSCDGEKFRSGHNSLPTATVDTHLKHLSSREKAHTAGLEKLSSSVRRRAGVTLTQVNRNFELRLCSA